jgi:hypothetical protein
MKTIMALLMAMLAMVVGANLIAPVNTAVSVFSTPTYTTAVVSLSRLLPLFLVILIMMWVLRGVNDDV